MVEQVLARGLDVVREQGVYIYRPVPIHQHAPFQHQLTQVTNGLSFPGTSSVTLYTASGNIDWVHWN